MPLSLHERLPLVLVADRTDLLRRNVTARLQAEGYEVLQASNGQEALAHLAKARPDAALIDSELPGISGLDLCRLAKGQLALAELHVMLTLSVDDLELTRTALGAGASQVIQKPLELDQIVERLEEILAPWPRYGQVLTLRALGTDRVCHVSGWAPIPRRGLSMEPGPELEWLGGDILRLGVPVVVEYSGAATRLARPASMRLVERRGGRREVEVIVAHELPRRTPTVDTENLALGVKYASPSGEYQPAVPYNVSPTGLRLGGVIDPLEIGSNLMVFFFHRQELQVAVRGTVRDQRPQDGRHFSLSLAFHDLDAGARNQLAALLKPGCLVPPV